MLCYNTDIAIPLALLPRYNILFAYLRLVYSKTPKMFVAAI